MRLGTFQRADGAPEAGLITGNGVVALGRRLGDASLRLLLREDRLREAGRFGSAEADYQLDEIIWLPVIPDPQHFFCVGTNYADHLKELQDAGVARPQPEAPALFVRFAETLVGHSQPLVIPRVSEAFDYEGELAVVIGRSGRYIPQSEALSYVAGYSCFNDASVRDWQFHTSQVTSGKNFLATGGFGPWLVTPDEIADPQALAISTRLNGQLLQDGNTADMIFPVAEIIAYASALLPLQAGDVIATGTPSGVGFSRNPPVFMKNGDVCEVTVDGVGTLLNRVVKDASK